MLLVTDLDGTLYSWVDFMVPALEAMVDSLCATTGEPRIRVVQALKEVYERYGSNEYPFAIQESELFHPYARDFDSFDRLVIDPARRAFAERRRRYLKLFPTVRDALARLRDSDVRVVALTDAPRNTAELRLRQLDLEGLISGVYCLPAFHFPETGVSPEIRRREERGSYRVGVPVTELPRDFEKPHTGGLLRICEDFGVPPGDVILVGDNLKKDVRLAQDVGAVDVWACYGAHVPPEYRDRLDVISARSVTRRHVSDPEGGEDLPVPTFKIPEFKDLLPIVADLARARRAAG
jgi:FMN phosphatase YigB (HAD superfamily)